MTTELERIEQEVLNEFGANEDFIEHLDNALKEAGYVYDPDAPKENLK